MEKSGEPIVLSGLIQNEETWSEKRTPWISKIPLLGWLFKSNNRTTEKTEMVIYLVPHWENDEEMDSEKNSVMDFKTRMLKAADLEECL